MRKNKNPNKLLLFIFFAISFINAKYTQVFIQPYKVREKKLVYLTKFYLLNGGGFDFSVRLRKGSPDAKKDDELPFKVLFYTEKSYKNIHSEDKCSNIEKKAFDIEDMKLPQNNSQYTKSKKIHPKNNFERQAIYVVMSDCDGALSGIPDDDSLIWNFGVKSVTGGHLDSDHEHLYFYHLILSFAFTLIYSPFVKRFYEEYKKKIKDTNYVFLIINGCVVLKVIGFVFDFIEMHKIKNSGYGNSLIGFIGHGSNYASQYVMCCTLIFLASGWTVTIDRIFEFEMFLPIAFIIGIFKIMIIVLAKVTSNEPDVHHRYDNWVGIILGVFQIGLFIFFVFEVLSSLKNAAIKKHKDFFSGLLIFGSIYFLTFPVLLFLTSFVPLHSRNLFIEVTRLVSEAVGILYMALITTQRRGVYKSAVQLRRELPF